MMMTPASWLLQTDSANNNRAFWNAGFDWTSPIEMGTQWIATSTLWELIPDYCRLTSKRPSQQLKPQTPILDVFHSKPKAITTCKTWIEGWWSKHKFFFLASFCKYFKSKIFANLQKVTIWQAYKHPSITCCNKNTPLPNQRTIILPKTLHTDRLTSLESVNANESLSPRNKRLHSRSLKSIIITGKVKEWHPRFNQQQEDLSIWNWTQVGCPHYTTEEQMAHLWIREIFLIIKLQQYNSIMSLSLKCSTDM